MSLFQIPLTPFELALRQLGVCEIPGPETNVRIAEYHGSVGLHVGDETSWCSSFRNWCEETINGEGSGTNSAAARSWLTWGQEVPLDAARTGDTVVFWRGSIADWRGHVAFFVAWSRDGKRVLVLGGNQSDAVTMKWYPVDRILQIRRAA